MFSGSLEVYCHRNSSSTKTHLGEASLECVVKKHFILCKLAKFVEIKVAQNIDGSFLLSK